jgi:hypothetical protein
VPQLRDDGLDRLEERNRIRIGADAEADGEQPFRDQLANEPAAYLIEPRDIDQSDIRNIRHRRGEMVQIARNSIYREVLRSLRQTWGTVMTEVVTAVLVFLSVGVFLAHAFDAYGTGTVGTRYPRY